jgi:hypothetical protein
VFDDGNFDQAVANIAATIRGIGPLRWDASSPPAFDTLLLAGSAAVITFTNLASIPLSIATAPNGLYRIIMMITATNSTDNDILLLPNNASYTNAFASYAIENSDLNVNALGNATAIATTTPITSFTNFPLQVSNIPIAGAAPAIGTLPFNSFAIDTFAGPANSANGVGPLMMEMLCSTIPLAKMVKASTMLKGGPAISGSIWLDTTTPWTSLGTLQNAFATQNSGVLRVERVS